MSFRDKTREWKSRFKAKFEAMLEGDEMPSRATTPGLTGSGVSSWAKSEGWANLEECKATLDQLSAASGLGPLKSVFEGVADCIGIYEDVAQGKKAYIKLRADLERIFKQLQKYLSLSPTVTESISSVCELIQEEIDYVKKQQGKTMVRRVKEAQDDEDKVLACYTRIRDHLQDLSLSLSISTLAIVEQHAMDDRLRELTPSLSARYNSGNAIALKRRPCTEGTRTSVLAGMYEWVAGLNTGNVYWMSGMAGTGKTTIAYSLCERLHKEASSTLAASFFCSRSLPECRSVERIIPSIAYQLAQSHPSFQHALFQAMKDDPNAYGGGPAQQFEALIAKPLSDAKVRATFSNNTVVVIDALDECDDVISTQQILGVLLTNSKDLPIKFFVSSRPEPAIRDQMEKNGTWVDARVVLHELDSGGVKTDIKTYLQAELAPVKPSESDIDRLAERAGVLFIYAATVVRYVGHDDFARGHARLKAVLSISEQQTKAQTKEIDQLYRAILEAAVGDMDLEPTERDDIKLILYTVICARAPLTVAALNQLLQLDDDDRVQAAIRPLWSVLHVMESNMTITTLHASFPDYLLDPERSGAWHCDAAIYHHLLAQRCFECIRDTQPQFNICRLESSYLLDEEVADLDERVQKLISGELRYSCQYWSSHLWVAGPDTAPDLMTLLSLFLRTHLLLWMEVRNLTKTFSATLGDLTAAKRWATKHEMTREATDLLSDAWRFASTFVSSPVSQSTPHLYVSMLPLLPQSSPVRQLYFSRFKGMVGVGGTALEQRQDALLAQWKFALSPYCIASSPDGIWVAIGGGTGLPNIDHIFLLDAFSGNSLLDLSQRDEVTVESIAFSPDSARLASGRSDGVILVWDITTGQPLFRPFKAHSDRVSSILYSHDGSYIVSASEDNTIRIWDALSSNPKLTPLIGHTWHVSCIATTSDDARLVSGSWDGTIRVWDIQNGKMVLDAIKHPDVFVTTIAFSRDDSYIVSGSHDCNIHVWSSQTGQMILGPLQDQGGEVVSLSISPDGATIASTSEVDGVRIWDATSGEMLSQFGPFSQHAHSNSRATYSPNGTRIILAHSDGTIRLLDTQAAAQASDPLSGHTDFISSIDVSPNGRHVVSGSWDHTLFVWDLTQGIPTVGPLQGHTGLVVMVRFSGDGGCILSCAQDLTIRQWDAQSGAVLGTPIEIALAEAQGVVSATYSQDGAHIVSLTYEGEISVWNSTNGQIVLGPIAAPNQTQGRYANFSPDGATAIAGYTDGSICVWDMQNGQMVYNHQGHEESDVSSLAFSPNGLHYALAFSDGKIRLKVIHTGEQMPGEFEGHTTYVNSVQFSSDGTQLVSGSSDNTVYVWDVGAKQPLFRPLNGHTEPVTSVAFSLDGKYVISASWDLAIRVWNARPKAHLRILGPGSRH